MKKKYNDIMEDCEICDHVVKVCTNLGKGEICKQAIEDLEQKKITIEELTDLIDKNFDKNDFKKEWDRLIDEQKEREINEK